MNLNPVFLANIQDIYRESGQAWIKNLPAHINHLCAKRSLRFISVMPGLTYNFVALVEVLDTRETAIIKMSPENKYIAEEARCLQCFGDGVARFYWYDDEEHAILMEHIEPGNSLKQLVREGKDDSATRIICQAIQRLQKNQTNKCEFKHIARLVDALSILKGHLDDPLLDKAVSLFHDLTLDRTQDVVLHGDLHHDNILASGSSWKVIDPHGYIGDPVFEVGSMIVNPYDCFPGDHSVSRVIERRLRILGEELPFDMQRIQAWTFCKTILSVAWTFEDHAKLDEGEVEIARAIERVKI